MYKESQTPPTNKKKKSLSIADLFPTDCLTEASSLSTGVLDREDTSLDGVDEDVPGLEVWVDGPSAEKVVDLLGVVLGVDIEVADFSESGTGWVRGDGGDVDDSEAGGVVAHVGLSVDDVEVVVDGLCLGEVDAGELGGGEVLDVPDVGRGLCVALDGGVFLLVELVVGEEVVHAGVGDPALVGVGGAGVGGAGDDFDGGLVGDVVDSEGVLVEAEADFLALVGGGWSGVDDALGVVDVAIRGGTALVDWGGWVRDIEHVETSGALVGADGVDHLGGLVGNDVVGVGDTGVEIGEVSGGRKDLWCGEGQELAEVEDLDTVVAGLGSNVSVAIDDLHVTPDGVDSLGLEATPVLEGSISKDLNESST